MRVPISLIAAGLLLQPAIFAQSTDKSAVKKVGEKVSDALDVFKDSVTGCLQRGDEASPYVVRDLKNNKSTTVVGSPELAQHVNHTVKVSGEFEDSGRILNAKEVEMIANDCSSNAGTSSTSSASRPSANASANRAERAADNTGVNKQVGRQEDVTADDQKVNSLDQDITRRIRRMVVEDKTLSTYAHNVKIITQDGQVTLKGPVRSESERSRIAELAASVAGASSVRNEMTVAP